MPSKLPQIFEIRIREISPPVLPATPPVTMPSPVMQLPGCAAVHPDAGLNPSLLQDDPSRVRFACPEGGIPTIEAMDYRPSALTILQPSVQAPAEEESEPPAAAPLPQLPATPEKPVPVAEEPVEPTVIERVSQYLPKPKAVTVTASIALVATTSALLAKPLADLLLKLIKPTVKKVVGKAKAKLGRTPRQLSLAERRLAQRERNRAVMSLRRALGR